ncbi:hypothetical protein BDR07DRAFT_1481464 [Suillus spraguei]|nr:hypothetical protein BDR07DRAFT_1481464 [Suillus spraguei]
MSQFIISILESQHHKGHLIVEDPFMHFDEINHLSSEEAGWHFGALHVTTKQLKAFLVDEIAIDMASCAPVLWDLLGFLLGADRHPATLENNLEDANEDTMMGGELAIDSMSTV